MRKGAHTGIKKKFEIEINGIIIEKELVIFIQFNFIIIEVLLSGHSSFVNNILPLPSGQTVFFN